MEVVWGQGANANLHETQQASLEPAHTSVLQPLGTPVQHTTNKSAHR